jgi:hypothetical protein
MRCSSATSKPQPLRYVLNEHMKAFQGTRVELKQRFSAEYRKGVHTRRGQP